MEGRTVNGAIRTTFSLSMYLSFSLSVSLLCIGICIKYMDVRSEDIPDGETTPHTHAVLTIRLNPSRSSLNYCIQRATAAVFLSTGTSSYTDCLAKNTRFEIADGLMCTYGCYVEKKPTAVN